MTRAAQQDLERRLAALEAEVAKLKGEPAKSWPELIFGTFANDPIYDEAMRLGRAYRESLRPKPKKKGRNGRPRHRSR